MAVGFTQHDPSRTIRAPRGTELSAKSWQTEAPLRMLMNNLDPEVAERPEDLVVYGGTGRAARSWEAYDAIVATLKDLEEDETLLVQSGKPVGVFRTNKWAPRVLIANSNLVGDWATWPEFRKLEAEGLMMYGQMTAGSWIYIGSQGIVQGTYETFVEMGRQHYGGNLAGNDALSSTPDGLVISAPQGRLTYTDPQGSLAQRVLFRSDEAALAHVHAAGAPFDADPEKFKLAAEAQRIQLAGLYDPMLAVATSNIEPLPHQIRAVYGELLPRTPLRFLLADDPGVVARFLQERNLLVGLRSPYVIRVHDLVVEGPRLAIVMDYVAGDSLRALLQRRGNLPPHDVATLGAQIAQGLAAVHGAAVAHRQRVAAVEHRAHPPEAAGCAGAAGTPTPTAIAMTRASSRVGNA